MRVEVLAREEIEEKMLMTPGDIVMMLNEMGGMRVQTTSPSLGAASVRIQGMRGRYTRVLSDGLPLFGEVDGLGPLQIPPMDLGQVEVIKGVASALYGAGAMGGVINLLSRRPGAEPEEEFLVNRSTRGATDAVTYLSRTFTRGWSGSLLGGGTGRRRTTSTTTRGPISQGTSAASFGLECSGMVAADASSSRQRALRTRIATAARRMARSWWPWPAVRRSPRDATVRRRCGGTVFDQGSIRRDRVCGVGATEPRSPVRRSP
jgi:outer membrane receptor protein involved in Fe transport